MRDWSRFAFVAFCIFSGFAHADEAMEKTFLQATEKLETHVGSIGFPNEFESKTPACNAYRAVAKAFLGLSGDIVPVALEPNHRGLDAVMKDSCLGLHITSQILGKEVAEKLPNSVQAFYQQLHEKLGRAGTFKTKTQQAHDIFRLIRSSKPLSNENNQQVLWSYKFVVVDDSMKDGKSAEAMIVGDRGVEHYEKLDDAVREISATTFYNEILLTEGRKEEPLCRSLVYGPATYPAAGIIAVPKSFLEVSSPDVIALVTGHEICHALIENDHPLEELICDAVGVTLAKAIGHAISKKEASSLLHAKQKLPPTGVKDRLWFLENCAQ